MTRLEILKKVVEEADKQTKSAKLNEFMQSNPDHTKKIMSEVDLKAYFMKAIEGSFDDYISFFKLYSLTDNNIIDEHSSPINGHISFSSY